MRSIGIFGGSYDPIHEAHISLARDAYEQLNLDLLILVPAKLQPFKLDKKVTSAEDRLEMVRLAVDGIPGLGVSDFEIKSDGVSYSYLTMRHMRETYPDAKLYFVTGTDAFLAIEKWMEAEEMLTNYSYVIGTRPGYKEDELKQVMKRVHEKFGTEVININNIQIDVSSTEIRERVSEGRSIMGMVPTAVEEYINAKGLYR